MAEICSEISPASFPPTRTACPSRTTRVKCSSALRAASILVRHPRVVGVSVTDLYRLGLVGLAVDPALVRLSVGIEDEADLLEDLERALARS